MRIMYLPHVQWSWIFQRPQIIGLLLEEKHLCTIVDMNILPSKRVAKHNRNPKHLRKAVQFRGGGKFRLIKQINDILYKLALRDINKFDAVWICSPYLFRFLPKTYKGLVIYDCMDNHVAMANPTNRGIIFENEQRLIERADIIFASSRKLIETIPNLKQAVLIRNGHVNEMPLSVKKGEIKQKYKMGYIGTIASWLDIELLVNSASQNVNIEYHLIGPIDIAGYKKNGRFLEKRGVDTGVYAEGVVEHASLKNAIRDYDALIMPFVLNETVLSVDPVKLYEYICYGKCIISIWYPEIDRFTPFVYFYHNSKDYDKLIKELINIGFEPKYNAFQQKNFLKENTWENRIKIINEVIEAKSMSK